MNRETRPSDFDAVAMFAAMDAQRTQRTLSWRQVANEIWDQSVLLNERRQDHPISPSTLTGIAKRGDCTCQHALFVLRNRPICDRDAAHDANRAVAGTTCGGVHSRCAVVDQ